MCGEQVAGGSLTRRPSQSPGQGNLVNEMSLQVGLQWLAYRPKKEHHYVDQLLRTQMDFQFHLQSVFPCLPTKRTRLNKI